MPANSLMAPQAVVKTRRAGKTGYCTNLSREYAAIMAIRKAVRRAVETHTDWLGHEARRVPTFCPPLFTVRTDSRILVGVINRVGPKTFFLLGSCAEPRSIIHR